MAYTKKQREPGVRLTIKWIMQEKGLVKFVEDTNDYKLSDKIKDFDFEKFGIKTGTVVEVFVNSGYVNFMKKLEPDQAVSTEVEQPKKQTNAPSETESTASFIWTVAGIPASKEVISFKEAPVKWYIVPKEVADNFEKFGVKARETVKVTLTTVDVKGEQKPAIKTIENVKTQETTQEVKKDNIESVPEKPRQYSSNNVQTSIEAQASVNSANELAGKLIGNTSQIEDNTILELITKIATHNFELIQTLKNK